MCSIMLLVVDGRKWQLVSIGDAVLRNVRFSGYIIVTSQRPFVLYVNICTAPVRIALSLHVSCKPLEGYSLNCTKRASWVRNIFSRPGVTLLFIKIRCCEMLPPRLVYGRSPPPIRRILSPFVFTIPLKGRPFGSPALHSPRQALLDVLPRLSNFLGSK